MSDFNQAFPDAYRALMRRRSPKARDMSEPAPNSDQIAKILAAGLRVPDHGKLGPTRFLVLTGDERQKFGHLISQSLIAEKEASADIAAKMEGYATQGPLLLIAIHSPVKGKIPEWEQILSSGASCMNILHSATALGFSAQWLTGWPSYSKAVAKGLGLAEDEKIAGLIFIGSHQGPLDERERPSLDSRCHIGFPSSI